MSSSEGTSSPQARKRSPLFVLFLIVVIDLIGFGIVLPLLPRYAQEYQASGVETGLLQASFSVMQFVFMPFWGRLSDRIGRRPVLMVGLVGSVLSYSLFGLANSLALLFASRIAAGIFGATIGTAQAYIADVTPQSERGRGMAVIGAAFGLGFAIGPTIGGLAHDSLGAAAPGFIAAGLSLLALICAGRMLPEPARHQAPHARAWFGGEGLRHALAAPTLVLVIALQFVATFAFANFEGTLSILTKVKWGYAPTHNGFLFSYVGICLLIFQGAVVRRLMPRVGELNFVVAGSLILGLGLVGVGIAANTTQALALLPVAVLGFSMLTPSLSSLLSRRTPPHLQGEVLGLGQSSLAMARILGPFAGLAMMGLGHPAPNVTVAATPERPYWFAAVVMGLALVGAIVLRARPVPDAVAPPVAG